VVPLGYILLIVGLIVAIYGQIRFLVLVYNRNLWWFLGSLVAPPVAWVFLFLDLKATIKPFGLSLLGLLVAGLSCWMSGVRLASLICTGHMTRRFR
jgi:hypothetical protein